MAAEDNLISAAVALMLVAYRNRQWDAAEEQAKLLASLYKPLTELARLYVNRIREYRENPPPMRRACSQ